ncbi:MAG TPA: YceI family protein [Planctomycetota bacterium]|nr:YceI family protein [Planctomycetota bacterium]
MNALALLLPLLSGEVRLGLDRYAIDPKASSIGFDGSSTLHDFTARAGRFGGEARVDLQRLGESSGGTVWIETESLDSGSKGRDSDMRELLESGTHPRITFALDRAEGRLEGERGGVQLRGRFTIRGVERARTISARIEPRPEGFRAVGEVRFPMSEHGIKPPRVLLIKTADEVRVWFDLAFRRVPAPERPSTVRRVEVREWTGTLTGDPEERVWTTRLWSCGDRLLWERAAPPIWIVGSEGAVLGVSVRDALRLAPASAMEGVLAGAESRPGGPLLRSESRPFLRSPGGGPASREDLGRRIRRAVEPGEVSVLRPGRETRIRKGEDDWAILKDLEGNEPFPPMLAGFRGMPRAVRDALGALRGMPSGVEVGTSVGSGMRWMTLSFGPPEPGLLPGWATDPAGWTETSETPLAW